MDLREAIFKRRSIRKYKSDPISDQDLKEILEAGIMAPSAVNLQPWYFVAIKSEDHMRELIQIMDRVSVQITPNLKKRFPNHPGVVEETQKFIGRLGGAPVCILAFQMKDDYEKTADTVIQSISAAIENILLAAFGKGIGSCWLTAPVEAGADTEIRDHFAPGKGKLVAIITLGYSDNEPKVPPRKDGRYIII